MREKIAVFFLSADNAGRLMDHRKTNMRLNRYQFDHDEELSDDDHILWNFHQHISMPMKYESLAVT